MMAPPLREVASGPAGTAHRPTIADLVSLHFDFVWRSLRRFGLSPSDTDDAAQQVFLVLNQKLGEVRLGEERAFLYGTARNIAARCRRGLGRRREAGEAALDEMVSAELAPDEALDRRRAGTVLNEILDTMTSDLREVFVLHEVEQETMAEISALLGIATGTVASRLRRARESFQQGVHRWHSRPPPQRKELPPREQKGPSKMPNSKTSLTVPVSRILEVRHG